MLQPVAKVPDKVTMLVAGRPKPDEIAIVEDGVEKHHSLDHATLCGRLSEAVVGLSDGRPEWLVMNVEHPATMELTHFSSAQDPKPRLLAAVSQIVPVRNEIAHVREIDRDRLLRATVACADILEMLKSNS
jgi:hypothetical protein